MVWIVQRRSDPSVITSCPALDPSADHRDLFRSERDRASGRPTANLPGGLGPLPHLPPSSDMQRPSPMAVEGAPLVMGDFQECRRLLRSSAEPRTFEREERRKGSKVGTPTDGCAHVITRRDPFRNLVELTSPLDREGKVLTEINRLGPHGSPRLLSVRHRATKIQVSGRAEPLPTRNWSATAPLRIHRSGTTIIRRERRKNPRRTRMNLPLFAWCESSARLNPHPWACSA